MQVAAAAGSLGAVRVLGSPVLVEGLMAWPEPTVDVNVRWRRRWLEPLLRLIAGRRLTRQRWLVNALLWLMPLDVKVGRNRPQRCRLAYSREYWDNFVRHGG